MPAEPQTSRSLRRSFIWPTVCHLALHRPFTTLRARAKGAAQVMLHCSHVHIHEKGFV